MTRWRRRAFCISHRSGGRLGAARRRLRKRLRNNARRAHFVASACLSMSETLSRSQQSAWQRWELASLGTEGVVSADPDVAARALAEQQAAQALEEAKAAGRAQGYIDGMTQAAGHV